MTTTDPRFYHVKDIAELLGVSPMTVYRQISNGRLRAFRIGRSYRISEPALSAFMQSIDTWQQS